MTDNEITKIKNAILLLFKHNLINKMEKFNISHKAAEKIMKEARECQK